MSKWKCEICGNEFENFHAQGFDSKIHCPLCFFKEKSNRLQQEKYNLIEYLENKITEYKIQFSQINGDYGFLNPIIGAYEDILERLNGDNNE